MNRFQNGDNGVGYTGFEYAVSDSFKFFLRFLNGAIGKRRVDGQKIGNFRLIFGFASGGSDLPTKVAKDMFGGGGGAGVTVTPVAFLVITGSDVKLMQLSINAKAANAVVNMVPDLMDKLTGFLNQKQQEKLKASEKNAQTED